MFHEKATVLDSTLDELEYCVFDIESTGVKPFDGDRILEIGAVKLKPGLRLDRKNKFHVLVNPGISIPNESIKIHGITNDIVKNAPDECTAFYQFLDYARGCVLVAHNAKKDMSFLKKIIKDYGIENPFEFVIDTLVLSKKINSFSKYHNLDALIDLYKVNIKSKYKRHRALYDAEVTSVIFRQMIYKAMDRGIYSLIELYSFIESKSD